MSRKVNIKAVRSDGRTFNYNADDWGIIGEIEGIDFPPVEIFKSDRGFGNGSIITGKRKAARNIDFVSEKRGLVNNERDRAVALGFHNTNYTYDVYITYMGNTRIAKNCELENFKCSSGNIYSRLTLTVSYLCADSDLFADASTDTKFVNVTPLWHVSRAYTEGSSLPFSIATHTTSKVVEYLGSEPTYVEAIIEASGYVKGMNIVINDVLIHIDIELNEGDVLKLDSQNKYITLNNVKVPEKNYNSEDLPNLMIEYGDNIISIYADDIGNTSFDSAVNYVGRYGGV